MKILIAEDNLISRHMLEAMLQSWGYDPVLAVDGTNALAVMREPDPPQIAVLDWMMPGLDGVQLTKILREELRKGPVPPYVVMLTAKTEKNDIVAALQAGADDYLTKPFHAGELRARLMVGERIVNLQRSLADRVDELELACGRLDNLEAKLPFCSLCSRVRDDQDNWQRVEDYTRGHIEALFHQHVCPDCYETNPASNPQPSPPKVETVAN